MVATAASVLVAAVIVTTRPTEEEAAIRGTVETFWNAVGHDGEKACQQLSGDAQARYARHEHDASCAHAAANADAADPAGPRDYRFLPTDIYDFGAADFGPDHEWAVVPSKFESGGEKFAAAFYPPIQLKEADSHWVIDSLNWFYEY